MTATTLTVAQKNLGQLMSDVNDSSTPVIIVNDNGKNAVLISEDDWNYIQTIKPCGRTTNKIFNTKGVFEF